jgi:hypothetical protein
MSVRYYQDALDQWIVSDGETKHTGFADEVEAARFARRLRVTSVAQEYLDLLRQATKQSEQLIDGLAPASRLRVANGLEALIMATPDDEYVPGTDMTGARAKELLVMYGSLNQWLSTPLMDPEGAPGPDNPTPIQVLSRRE